MKKLIFLLPLLLMLLTSCLDGDGVDAARIPFVYLDKTAYIEIDDAYDDNKVYLSESGHELYCEIGPARTISLPSQATFEYNANWKIYVKLDARAVCSMGQENFDLLLSAFTLKSEEAKK